MGKSLTQSPPLRKPRLPRRARPGFVVIKKLDPLRDGPAGRVDVRVVEVRPGERRLDVRQYLEDEDVGFTGYTRRGICLTSEEFDVLLEQRDAILRLLGGGRG